MPENADELYERISLYRDRIKELEAALGASHSSQALNSEPHPLLAEDLVSIAREGSSASVENEYGTLSSKDEGEAFEAYSALIFGDNMSKGLSLGVLPSWVYKVCSYFIA